MHGGLRGKPKRSRRWPQAGAALRAALEARSLIAVAAFGAATTCAVLRDDWTSFASDYLLWDFGLTNLACFDLVHSGRGALLTHIAISAAWIAGIAYLTPWIGEHLAGLF